MISFDNIKYKDHFIPLQEYGYKDYGLLSTKIRFVQLSAKKYLVMLMIQTGIKIFFTALLTPKHLYLKKPTAWMMNILATLAGIGQKNRFPIPLNGGRNNWEIYPNLFRLAFDLFAIPAMSSECELALSKASYTIAARRSSLSSDIVEGGECLRSWISSKVVELATPVELG